MYSPPTTSAPGTPLITRLARRYIGALAIMRTNPARANNRFDHIHREADKAGIDTDALLAEIKRLQEEKA
ncbi:hypothetical protein QDA01_gp31 [Microbacterium phage Cinna]|uniref:Uncharacterized protein n=1 Tax=Microbacterium phage Cinna TaxID=2591215 RepID=A0A514DDH8_9CAUD|nr:hypothetical protein QDA01_gp31 [Microbacterium phage Cinna]QDH91658.1 hypothetical protein PBI_CINNA_74 [Microbacterium phage Cinna]